MAAGQLPHCHCSICGPGQLPHCQCSLWGRWPASSMPVFPLQPLASFLSASVPFAATGELPQCQYSLRGRWPASSVPVFPLRPLASFLNASIPFAAAGQLPQCQCSLCGRWPACWPFLIPTPFFLSLFFIKSLRLLVGLLVGLTAKLCICPPACLSRGAWSQLGLSEWGGVGRAHFPASCPQLVLWPRCGGPSYQLYFVVLCHANSPPLLSSLLWRSTTAQLVRRGESEPIGPPAVAAIGTAPPRKARPDWPGLLTMWTPSRYFFPARFSAVFLDSFCPTFSRSRGLMI